MSFERPASLSGPFPSARKISAIFKKARGTMAPGPEESAAEAPETSLNWPKQSEAMHAGFVSALQAVKRKGRAHGMATPSATLKDIAKAYFADTTGRLYARRGLELEKERLETEKAMHAEDIKLGYYKAETEMQAAEKAAKSTGGLFGGGGFLGLGCIIISACTSPYSYEVNIARQYRDHYLGPITLAGYYALSHKIAPLILKSRAIKALVKNHLVDNLTDYFEWFLGYRTKRQLVRSRFVTKNFLRLCKILGHLTTRHKAIEYLKLHR